MREIKFRGYDAVSGKGWVYGDLVHNQRVTTTGLEPRTMVGGYEVIPDTVGEFTGLTDEVEQEIYENDVIQWQDEQYKVIFHLGVFLACNCDGKALIPFASLSLMAQASKVIGNIHDNPELILTATNNANTTRKQSPLPEKLETTSGTDITES